MVFSSYETGNCVDAWHTDHPFANIWIEDQWCVGTIRATKNNSKVFLNLNTIHTDIYLANIAREPTFT